MSYFMHNQSGFWNNHKMLCSHPTFFNYPGKIFANNNFWISPLWVLRCMMMSNWVIAYKITTWYHVAFHANFMQKVFWKKKCFIIIQFSSIFLSTNLLFFQITHYKNFVLQDGFILTHQILWNSDTIPHRISCKIIPNSETKGSTL